MYTNTDILQNKLTELEIRAYKDNIDIIAVCETLPKELPVDTTKDDFKFVIKGFKAIQNNNGRGICVFIKDDVKYDLISVYDDIFNCSIVFKMKSFNDIFTICLLYRSPNVTEHENDQILTLIDALNKDQTSPNHKLLLMGDFNVPTINWTLECTESIHRDDTKHFDS